jgi:hypothetical protein
MLSLDPSTSASGFRHLTWARFWAISATVLPLGRIRRERYLPPRSLAKLSSTSFSSGKRPAADFEKISLPSTMTSNCPVFPALICASSPKRELSDAARLAARGW